MISTGWTDVESAVVADRRRGLTLKWLSAKHGMGRVAIRGILERNGMSTVDGGPRRQPLWARWTDDEFAPLLDSTTAADAIERYYALFPASIRTPRAIADRWASVDHKRPETGGAFDCKAFTTWGLEHGLMNARANAFDIRRLYSRGITSPEQVDEGLAEWSASHRARMKTVLRRADEFHRETGK